MRLLLAEDEEDLSKALVAVLKYNNYSVDAVYDGEEALSYIEAGNYDGVILDIMMPKLDGISVLKKVRANGNSIPILLLTAKAEIDEPIVVGNYNYTGEEITVEFCEFIRSEIRFDNMSALKSQMEKDKAKAKEFHNII